jgi:hypothetical protein
MRPNASKSFRSADLSNIFPLVEKEIFPFPAIQLIFVIEVKGNPKRLFRRFSPFYDLLAPIHAHIVVHLTSDDHFLLHCIPVWIMGLPLFQHFRPVNVFARVGRMRLKGVFCPLREAPVAEAGPFGAGTRIARLIGYAWFLNWSSTGWG